MAMLDGELSVPRTWQVRRHVNVCPDCKALLQRYTAVRISFSSDSLFPVPPAAHETAPQRIPLESSTMPPALGLSDWSWSSTIAASISMVLGVFLLWHLLVTPPGVSAREVIAQARLEEERPLLADPGLRLERVLRTTKRVRGVVEHRAEFQETWQLAPGGEIAVTGADRLILEISGSLPDSTCSGLDPLSARMMECLSRQDNVELRLSQEDDDTDGAFYELTIRNLRHATGNAFTSAWTLRLSDWRITRAVFQFPDAVSGVEYALEEMDHRMVDAPQVMASVRSPRTGNLTPNSNLTQSLIPTAPAPNPSEVKLPLLLALHRLQLTPEDEIEINWQQGPPFRLHALVRDELRRQQWLAALEGQQGVHVTVQSFAEAVSQLQADAATTMVPASSFTNTLRGEGPLLLDMLAAHLGGGQRGRTAAFALGESILEQVIAIRFRAHWIERTRDALPPDERGRLTPASLSALAEMEAAMVNDLSLRHQALRRQVEEILCPQWCVVADGDSQPVTAGVAPHIARSTPDLIGSLDAEFAWLQMLFVDRAFTGTHFRGTDGPLLQKAIRSWLQTHAQVSAELARRHQELEPSRSETVTARQ